MRIHVAAALIVCSVGSAHAEEPAANAVPAVVAEPAKVDAAPGPVRVETAPLRFTPDRDLARDLQTPSPGGAGKPRAMVVDTPDFQLSLRGFGQFVAIPYLGKDALVATGDVSDFAGFRVRRLNLGVEGRAGDLSFGIWLDPIDPVVLTQARIAWSPLPEANVEAGVVRIPFSRSAVQSSAEILFTERPLTVDRLVPDRQPGIAIYGAVLGGLASYRAGLFNGADASRLGVGNDHPGLLSAGRLAISPLGALRAGQADVEKGPIRAEIGLNGFTETAAAHTGTALGIDVSAQGYGGSVLFEYITDTRKPLTVPTVAPTLLANVTRNGWILQGSYLLWVNGPLVAARLETVDDNTNLKDVGDVQDLVLGVHWYLRGLDLRCSIDWYSRKELFGAALENDALVLGTQGRF